MGQRRPVFDQKGHKGDLIARDTQDVSISDERERGGEGDFKRGTRECRSSGQAKKEKRNSSVPARYLCHEITQETQRGCFRLLLAMRGKANSTSIFTHLEEFLAVLFKRLECVSDRDSARTDSRTTSRLASPRSNNSKKEPVPEIARGKSMEFSTSLCNRAG
ncbi:uncharacterized protein LOC143360510 [Halictus rubicundus]|uniref:uncharacterized protein LOC143360510 n=1 Tax=Halictus rubicundus TaxID=77578 RepID=UPI0040373302